MLQEAIDFRDESQALYDLAAPLSKQDFDKPTGFKQWTLNDIIAHLHYFNMLADYSMHDESRFASDYAKLTALRQNGESMVTATDKMLDGLKGQPLLLAWRTYYDSMADSWVNADPKRRLQWVGPTMSVRSSMTARLMETWSHAQAVYDMLGTDRQEDDRIKSVAVIGVNTFAWTFVNRKLDVPANPPYLRLSAPSGAIWEWNPPSDDNRIEGLAVEFCQVVTQTRNIADTQLKTTGQTATDWMAFAQCFAGPPQDPPAPGTRKRAASTDA